MLHINNLTISAGVNSVIDSVSLQVNAGEMLALVGESGCGKSVTALSILGLLPQPPMAVSAGSIEFASTQLLELGDKDLEAIRGRDIAMIFQEPMTSLNPLFSIGSQIAEVLYVHGKLARGFRKKQGRQKATALLERVGFARAEQSLDRFPHQLSGGQRQRAMIAMALACEPAVLIADEPTTALDVTVQAQILELLRSLCTDNQLAVLLITHDLGVVRQYCDQVSVMYCGQVVESGNAEAVFNHPHHRYTQALLKTIPAANTPGSRLPAIAGSVPPPGQRPTGCRYHPRCHAMLDKCTTDHPELTGKVHPVRCWNPAL